MSLSAEMARSRQDIEQSFGRAEIRLVRRYGRLRPLKRLSAYRRFRKAVASILRRIGFRPASPPEPWLSALKHVERSDEAKPLVIWALGVDPESLRDVCRDLETRQASFNGYAPVLVTDVADFAFFSRLGWLVEYVPSLSAPAGRYAERKRRYLAWRYRDAEALPILARHQESLQRQGSQIG